MNATGGFGQRLFGALLVALDLFEHCRHVSVEDRRQVERDELREEQSADHHQTERLPRFAARAVAESDGHRAQQRRHGGHHDGAEADQAAFVDGLGRREALIALGFESEVDLHDRVLFHDADQHDESHERVDVQIHVEQIQRDQRAEAGRRQSGKNRQRVNVAFVQDAEHDVHHQDRDDQQNPQIAERTFERFGRAFEVRCDSRRARSRSARSCTFETTSPSEAPGFKLNETVTALSCP